jgi:hypothetical protein
MRSEEKAMTDAADQDVMRTLAAGIYQWTAPHPTYRTSIEEVNCFALVTADVLAVVDPQLPPDRDPRRRRLLARLDELATAPRRLEILITIPYHTRSSESLYERYWSTLPTRIWGDAGVAKRLTRHAPLQVVAAGTPGRGIAIADGAAVALAIGKPRRSETPLYFPAHRAVVFGDAIVGTDEGLRLWNQSPTTSATWYREVFVPTLRVLLDLELDHVLVTHGPCAVGDGRRALEECLAAPPVHMY